MFVHGVQRPEDGIFSLWMVVLDGACGCQAVAGTEPEASGEAASTLGVSGLEQVLPS